ncbi:MAG: hypothetical protein ABIJ65_11275 [Chloroflexota bacterium]
MKKAYFWRIFGSMLVGLLIAGIVSEGAFQSMGNTISRPPQIVELVIPAGTSEKVSNGQSVVADGMIFMVGDTLELINQDSIAHTFGPLFVPPGSSARLSLDTPESLAFSCSFEPSQYYGLDVREALSPGTRIKGILLAGIPMGLLLSVYSVIAWPFKEQKKIPPTPK